MKINKYMANPMYLQYSGVHVEPWPFPMGCVRRWREDDSEDHSASLWGGSVSVALCCHRSSFEMWLQGTCFPRRTPNVLAGSIWLPAGFISFSVSSIHVWHFGLLNADNKNMKTLKHFGHLQRHEGTIFSIWWRMQMVMAWNQQRVKTEWNVTHTFSD